MRKTYLDVYPAQAITKAHTVKTFEDEVFVNCWDGDFISRNNPGKRVASCRLYHDARNIERDGVVIASRASDIQPLRYLMKPIPLERLL